MTNPDQESTHSTVLDGDEQQIGRLYGRAILGAAGDRADEIVAQLKAVVDECLTVFPALEKTLASPRVSQEQKEAMLDRIFKGRVDAIVLNFMKVLCRRDRIGSLRAVQVTAAELRDEQLGKLRVLVTSAHPLSESQRNNIVARMSEVLSKQIVLDERVDTSLLGGIVIRVGDQVFDGSVAGKFDAIRNSVASGIHKAIRDKYESLMSS
jgi:F-type H+-transporting ATPase subunit delta